MAAPRALCGFVYTTYVKLKARGPNQAREGIIFGPQDDIQLLLDLARNTTRNIGVVFIVRGNKNDLVRLV